MPTTSNNIEVQRILDTVSRHFIGIETEIARLPYTTSRATARNQLMVAHQQFCMALSVAYNAQIKVTIGEGR